MGGGVSDVEPGSRHLGGQESFETCLLSLGFRVQVSSDGGTSKRQGVLRAPEDFRGRKEG